MKSHLKKEATRIKKTGGLARLGNKDLSSPQKSSPALTFFPLSDSAERLCSLIHNNLFQLEKDLAYFQFVIKEVKDISRFKEEV